MIWHEKRIEDTAADDRDEIIAQEKATAPAPLEITSEHPHGEHVEKNMQQSAVQKLISKELPNIELVEDQWRH